MSHRTNRLNVERLESRELMAGDIAAVATNGVLFLGEARFQSGQANLVTVRQLPSGQIRVVGQRDASGDRTLVNGAAFKDFPSFTRLAASLGNGNDILSVVGVRNLTSIGVDMSIPGATDTDQVGIFGGTRTNGEVRIVTGGGVDSVFIQDTRVGNGIGLESEHLTIDTGTGADVVNLAGGVSTKEGATILTGEGDDQVLVRGTTIGDGRGFRTEDLFIDTAAGADFLHFGSSGESVRVHGRLHATTAFGFEADVDTVQMFQTTALKGFGLLTGGGDDQIVMALVSAGGTMSLNTGDGNDTAKLLQVGGGQFFIFMAAGDDTLDLTSLSALNLNANGGEGADRVTTFLLASGTPNFTNWEVINGVTVPPAFDFLVTPGVKAIP